MKDDTKRVRVFDTTLRDGEQSPGISLNRQEKLEIAHQLARLGVDVIEAGFPISSPGDSESVQAIAREVQGPVICGLARTSVPDIDAAWNAVKDSERPRIHTFISTSDIHIEHQLRTTREDVKGQARAAVAHARSLCDDVEFSPMDATRSELEFTAEVVAIALEEGATTINVPDTVGYATPKTYGEIFALIAKLPIVKERNVILSSHCHNDLGLATANSLAGVQAGARQIEVCVNGLGERAGNAALEEVVMALRIRPDQFPGIEVGIKTEELSRASRMVARLTGYPVQYNKAVVGRNAFAHESGIHQHGVLADSGTYEIIDAAAVGQTGRQIVLGKHSGRHAFAETLERMGLRIQGDALNAAFQRFKELADRKVTLTDADLEAIVAEELGGHVDDGFELESLDVRGGTVGTPLAAVVLVHDGRKLEASAEGDGMIDAACKAIKAATGIDGALTDFNVSSVTGGVDALGDVIVQFESEGIKVSGRGLSTDVVEASARAFLSAVNKVVRVRQRQEQVRQPEVTP
ncbi:MAG: 2-isopropylmalate synthase [Actinomycetota bacterium]|nr:2-isopropylmalate synthase [Actinomycetota bacterium]